MSKPMTRRALLAATAAVSATALTDGVATAAARPDNCVSDPYGRYPPHLLEAERLLGYRDLLPWELGHNRYRMPTPAGQPDRMVWGNPGDPASYVNLAQCASFQTGILYHSYPQWATA